MKEDVFIYKKVCIKCGSIVETPYPQRRVCSDCKKFSGRVYKITSKEWNELFLRQQGRCAICKKSGKLYVDHDHNTGKVRGLLCPSCNGILGTIETRKNINLFDLLLYISKNYTN